MPSLKVLKFITAHPLNKGVELQALVRFAKWQICSRLINKEATFEWVNGSKFLVKAGDHGLTGNIYCGLQEFADMGYLLHVLRPEDLFVDVGANLGAYTILACSAVGARGWAFEPVPSTYRRLIENIRLNRLEGRVQHRNFAIGRESGMIAFTSDLDTVNHALADHEPSVKAIQVRIEALNDLLKGATPSLMKIDVEGYEMPVIEGASTVLSNPALHSIIMEMNGSGQRYGYDEAQILSILANHEFQTYTYDPLTRELGPLHGRSLKDGNTLFIRDRALVLERIRSSPPIKILGKTF